MQRKINFVILVFMFLSAAMTTSYALGMENSAANYLCELGVNFYNRGRYEDALMEFKKALMLDPNNKTAWNYINNIFTQERSTDIIKGQENFKLIDRESELMFTREQIVNNALDNFSREGLLGKSLEQFLKKKREPGIGEVKVKGETQLSLGITPQDAIWKQANGNLNEENSRILSNAAFDRRTNTFDTRIYDRLKLVLDSDNKSGLNFHGNITVDPWSFIGKSPRLTVSSIWGDTADVELKYWSNTGYAINEIIFSNRDGNTFALPEIKVKDGKTNALVVNGGFWPPDQFSIPSTKINRGFHPIREFWLDYKEEGASLRFFPIAYQDQALTSDDPLVLSNNRTFWQQSPWLDRWQAGRLNSGAVPVDFTRGRFDESLSYFTRDSDGTFLTALRGLAFELNPDENLSLSSTFASPKGLWQDYNSIDNIINATRLKYRLLDNLSLGSLFTYRLGLNENNTRDATNYLWGTDLGYEPKEGVKVSLEVAASRSQRDLASEEYKSKSRGNAYYFSVMGRSPKDSIMNLKYGYNDIKPKESDMFFVKYRFYIAHMDAGFNPALSNYRETRDDTFWSRHIHFRRPFKYYFAGLDKPTLSWYDIEPYRIGNGIDIGRDAFGFRLETSLFNTADNLFDVRNVHKTNGKFVENVARDEFTYKPTEKVTTKFLGIYQRLPKTKGGFDPFIFDKQTDLFVINTAIEDGKDPSLKTGTIGAEYALTDRVALSGIWERTNDSTLAYDNFPRGDLDTSSLTTFSEYGKIFRRDGPSVYSQGLFPLPKYPYYDIWKTGLRFNPTDNLEINLDYTRNEFKSAGYIDDNINHIGFDLSYLPIKKLGFFFRYTYSRWNDINRMLGGYNKIYLGHHNFFTEFRYFPATDYEFVLQYGESGLGPISTVTYDPFSGGLATLDTRHIIRLYYRRKF